MRHLRQLWEWGKLMRIMPPPSSAPPLLKGQINQQCMMDSSTMIALWIRSLSAPPQSPDGMLQTREFVVALGKSSDALASEPNTLVRHLKKVS